jgi:hypothetical protein
MGKLQQGILMDANEFRSSQLNCRKPARIRAMLLAVGSVVGLQFQLTPSQAASPAPTQSLQRLIAAGQTIIHATPIGSGALATPEIVEETEIGVKPQITGRAAAATTTAASTRLHHRHGLPIPSKQHAANGATALAARGALTAAAVVSLPAPQVASSRVIGFPGAGASGFPGLTHFDQRTANGGNQFSLEPPDQAICAGNGFVMEAVNNAIRVYDQFGNPVTPVEAMSTFFGLADEFNRTTGVVGPFVSDPRCAYDKDTQRWFVIELMNDDGDNVGTTGRNFNLIAVSQTSDPRGAFTVFKYDVTDDGLGGTSNHAGCPCFGDQPLLGFDRYGVYESTNEFSATDFNGAQLYAISKRGLANAADGSSSTLPVVVHIDASQQLAPFGGLSYTIQPATGRSESSNGVEYFLSALQFGNPGYETYDNRIAVWALTNTRSLSSRSPSLALSFEVISSETYGQPDPVDQRPGPTPLADLVGEPLEQLQSNDDRMNQVVYSNGLLFGAVNSKLSVRGADQTGIAWFAVRPTLTRGAVHGQVVRQGYVAVAGNTVMFPAIGQGSEDRGAMVFTLVGPDYFPSAAFVRLGESGTSAVRIAGAGVEPDDGFTAYAGVVGVAGPARWGDYSAAASDGENLWLATEYIPGGTRTVLANWGTYITKVKP